MADLAGKLESRRLLGDVILTGQDLRGGWKFDDGCFPRTWDIDTRFPDQAYRNEHEGEEFIANFTHDAGDVHPERRRGNR